jgi:hypothetical protein
MIDCAGYLPDERIKILQPILDGAAKFCDVKSGVRSKPSCVVNLAADAYDVYLGISQKNKKRVPKNLEINMQRMLLALSNMGCSLLLANNVGEEKYRPFLQVFQALLEYAQAVYPDKKLNNPVRALASAYDVVEGMWGIKNNFAPYSSNKTPTKKDLCAGCRLPFGDDNIGKIPSCNHWFCVDCIKSHGETKSGDVKYDCGDWINRGVRNTKMCCPVCYEKKDPSKVEEVMFMGKALDDNKPVVLKEDDFEGFCFICTNKFEGIRRATEKKCMQYERDEENNFVRDSNGNLKEVGWGCKKDSDKLICIQCCDKIKRHNHGNCPFCKYGKLI